MSRRSPRTYAQSNSKQDDDLRSIDEATFTGKEVDHERKLLCSLLDERKSALTALDKSTDSLKEQHRAYLKTSSWLPYAYSTVYPDFDTAIRAAEKLFSEEVRKQSELVLENVRKRDENLAREVDEKIEVVHRLLLDPHTGLLRNDFPGSPLFTGIEIQVVAAFYDEKEKASRQHQSKMKSLAAHLEKQEARVKQLEAVQVESSKKDARIRELEGAKNELVSKDALIAQLRGTVASVKRALEPAQDGTEDGSESQTHKRSRTSLRSESTKKK
ncbi:MAG: hypothetical protein M1831_002907 [Alyxoria varia]|nr:MAG: hypothetical protein M1831_002907 [Alyxoria varia]